MRALVDIIESFKHLHVLKEQNSSANLLSKLTSSSKLGCIKECL